MNRSLIIFFSLIISISSFGQGSLKGHVSDISDNTSLVEANIYFPELSKGVVSNERRLFNR